MNDRDVTSTAAVTNSRVVDAPENQLQRRGRALWDATTASWQPTPLHRELLLEACRIVDRLERLDRQLQGEDWLRFRASPTDENEIHVYVDRVLSEAREQESALKGLVIELLKVAGQPKEEKGGGVLAGLADELAAKRRQISAG